MEIWKKMWVGVFFWTQCTIRDHPRWVGRGRICLASFNSPSTKPPAIRKDLRDISYTSRLFTRVIMRQCNGDSYAPSLGRWKCRSGKIRSIQQGWKMKDWKAVRKEKHKIPTTRAGHDIVIITAKTEKPSLCKPICLPHIKAIFRPTRCISI